MFYESVLTASDPFGWNPQCRYELGFLKHLLCENGHLERLSLFCGIETT